MNIPFDMTGILAPVAPMPTVASVFYMSIPMTISVLAAVMYYNDYIDSRTRQIVDPGRIEEFEFIVVGGGSSGNVIANRLSKNYRVLLLEAGGDPHPLSYVPALSFELQRYDATDWQFRTEPQNNCALAFEEQRVLWPRGKGLGGSSSLNFMMYQRGHPQDYEQLAEATGDPEWSYEQLLPFFKKSEDYHGFYRDNSNKYHGQGGPLYVDKMDTDYMAAEFLAAGQELGYSERDLNTIQRPGFSRLDVTYKNGARWSTYEAFIRPILHRPNLVIYRYARAIKIHIDKGKRVYGVTYMRHGNIKFVRASREVVLSAGAIDSPKLLMLSGVGDCLHLHSLGLPCRAHLPVGNNLQDHVVSMVGPFTLNSGRSFILDRDFDINTINDYLDHREGYLSSLVTSAALALIPSSISPDPTWPDLGVYHNSLGMGSSLAEGYTRILGAKPGVFNTYFAPHIGRDSNFVWIMLGKPKSRGVLRLASRSPWDKPVIQPNYYSHPDDMSRMIEAAKFAVSVFENTTVYRQLGAQLANNPFPGCEHVPFKSDAYYECYLRYVTHTIYHPCGTCSMGKAVNDSVAVVDSELRVRKVHGLRVADASVLRHITNANLNAPSIMIGERAADLILRYWAQQRETCTSSDHYFTLGSSQKCFYSTSSG